MLLPPLLLLRVLLPDGRTPARLRKAGSPRRGKVLLNATTEDPARTEELWRSLSDRLRAFLRSRVPSDCDADDLLQDVFVRVYENVHALRRAERVESWAYQIARNAAADFHRRGGPATTRDLEEAAEAPSGPSRDANRNQAVGAWLALAIERLPPTLREAVRLYELEGLSQAGVAERLGLSLPGAKSRE